ncbi:hypothetical protein [Thermaerobacter subterraneus]|uniref:Uncharacterized protein n=1 Tax=Thermaerobacter subterraneus DSM 13965 TaxID=867903 RepID=K6QCA4_9FIRM|nr:hypothetical protein [Thermaerobacter subterraneus]EKP94106.1 hypothetical protein ThesuDRAFT_01831 [Thermaerobacter subterraneus DSM 13965]
MGKLFRVVVKALRESRNDRPTPEEVLSGSERALLTEAMLVLAGITAVGGLLAIWWMVESLGFR